MIRHLDLFSGIGGFALAVQWLGGETVGFVEWDAWNRRVLAKQWPEARYHGDIKTFTGDVIRSWGIRTQRDAMAYPKSDIRRASGDGGHKSSDRTGHHIDLITGGYPCQPFSLAGQRLGAEDDRHLWPEMRRVIDLCRPRFVLAENVAGHISMGLDVVLSELEADGYTCGAVVIPAGAVNALHRRDRVWIMATTEPIEPYVSTVERGHLPRLIDEYDWDEVPEWERDEWSRAGTHRPVAYASGTRAGDHGRADRGQAWERSDTHQPTLIRQVHGPGSAGRLDAGSADESLADALRERQPGPRPCEHASDSAQNREGQAGYAVDGSPAGEGAEVARSLDAGADGLPAGLVRRLAAGPDEPDLIRAAWADGSWEIGLPRVVADEPERRQKLMAAGNAIVPQVAYELLSVMMEARRG